MSEKEPQDSQPSHINPAVDVNDLTRQEFELHAHSKYTLLPEAVPYKPELLVRKAAAEGLDGIALTGHDTFKGIDEALAEAEERGIILIPGVEISSLPSRALFWQNPHILALFPDEAALDLLYRNIKPPYLHKPRYIVDWIHQNGGVAIAPHPNKEGSNIALSHEQIAELGPRLEGIETHTRKGEDLAAKQLAIEHELASIGSTDVHHLEDVGLVRTAVFGDGVATAQDVIQAIKEKRVEGFLAHPIPDELRQNRRLGALLRDYRAIRADRGKS